MLLYYHLRTDTVTSTTTISGYPLVDASILADVFLTLCCPGCHTVKFLELIDINEKKKGLARQLHLKCTACLPIYQNLLYFKKAD